VAQVFSLILQALQFNGLVVVGVLHLMRLKAGQAVQGVAVQAQTQQTETQAQPLQAVVGVALQA
jgi:hypothetical protein